MKETYKLKKLYFSLSTKLPKWMAGRWSLDHQVWELMELGNSTITKIITNKILKDNTIKSIGEDFDEIIDALARIGISKDEQILIAMYWLEILSIIREKCLDEEEFECLSNIKRFVDYYLIPLPIQDDE